MLHASSTKFTLHSNTNFVNYNKKETQQNFHSAELLRYVRERIRTPDTLVRSQVLYPAELRTHIYLIQSLYLNCNAGDRNRTGTGV